jgi:excinuclease UvrABC ATPase subunit
MKPLNILERLANWLDDTFYFNCKKGRHRWGYTLSETGVVYLDDNDVPDSAWHCTDCGKRRYEALTNLTKE